MTELQTNSPPASRPASPPPHVLVLSSHYVVDDPRVFNESKALADAGCRVTAAGIAIQGVQQPRETAAGMQVITVPWIASRDPRVWLRELWRWLCGDARGAVGTYSFRKGTPLLSVLLATLWLLRVGWRGRADVIHCHEHRVLPAALLLKLRHRAALVYDAHEDVPRYLKGFKRPLGAALEKVIFRFAAAVICPGEGRAAALRARGARNVVVVGNWKRLDDYTPDPAQLAAARERLGLAGYALVVSYIGSFAPERELLPLLAAVEQSPQVCLLIAGRGEQQSIVEAAAARTANIRWLGFLKLHDVPLYTALSDVIYYALDPTHPVAATASPNKLYEAFAAGKALIARRGQGEIGELLEEVPAGVLLDRVTPETLCAAFAQLTNRETLHAMQQAAYAARLTYNWAVAEARLRALYAQLVQG